MTRPRWSAAQPVTSASRARVTVDFTATYDAGVLVLHQRDDLWAKLCFELVAPGASRWSSPS